MTTIRMLKEQDIPACLHVIRQNWDAMTTQLCYMELTQAFGISVWKPVFYVAEDEGIILGLSGYAASWLNYDIYEISWINVAPEHQGKGIGRALIERCLTDIKDVGVMAMLSTDSPTYFEKWWDFKQCFSYGMHGKSTVMKLAIESIRSLEHNLI